MPLPDAALKCLIGPLNKSFNSWCFCTLSLNIMNPAEKALPHVCLCLHSKPSSDSCGLLH